MLARPCVIAATMAALVLGATSVSAQSGTGYSLNWFNFAGGGTTFSVGGGYSLGESTGQSGTDVLTGGIYQLIGGFWAIDLGGAGVDAPPINSPATIPTAFRLLPGFPNPFSDLTTIAFELPDERDVEVRIFSLGGAQVRTLINGVRPAGRHFALWDGRDASGSRMPFGIYFASVRAGRSAAACKLVMIK